MIDDANCKTSHHTVIGRDPSRISLREVVNHRGSNILDPLSFLLQSRKSPRVGQLAGFVTHHLTAPLNETHAHSACLVLRENFDRSIMRFLPRDAYA